MHVKANVCVPEEEFTVTMLKEKQDSEDKKEKVFLAQSKCYNDREAFISDE